MTNPPLALVTGGARGIGREVCRRLGAGGALVLAGVRDPHRARTVLAELASEADVRPIRLDVTDARSVDDAARMVTEEHGRLDVLVNNAGIALEHGGDPLATDVDILRATYETNVFGVVAVTNAFLPLLRRSTAGRIVNVSSVMGSLTAWSDPHSPVARHAPVALAYNSSKTALNAVTVAYARALAGSVTVNAVDPGFVATDLNGHTGYRSVTEGAEIVVRLATMDDELPTGGFFSDTGPVAW